MWKSNTSLYSPPAQPSLTVIGADVQLVTDTAAFPFLEVFAVVYPKPPLHSISFRNAEGDPGIVILLLFIIN